MRYPDFEEHPEHTDEGRPFRTAADKGCPRYKSEAPGQPDSGDSGCCGWFYREEAFAIIGVPSGTHPAKDVTTGAVYYGGNLYRVVANDATTMTLFHDGSIGNMQYNSTSDNKDWSGSDICNYLNTTFLNTFSAAEQAAIPDCGTTEIRNSYFPGADIDISQKIVLPSYDEVKDSGTWSMDATSLDMGDWWWLLQNTGWF